MVIEQERHDLLVIQEESGPGGQYDRTQIALSEFQGPVNDPCSRNSSFPEVSGRRRPAGELANVAGRVERLNQP